MREEGPPSRVLYEASIQDNDVVYNEAAKAKIDGYIEVSASKLNGTLRWLASQISSYVSNKSTWWLKDDGVVIDLDAHEFRESWNTYSAVAAVIPLDKVTLFLVCMAHNRNPRMFVVAHKPIDIRGSAKGGGG